MFKFIKRLYAFFFPTKVYVVINKKVSTINGQVPMEKDSKMYLERLGFQKIKDSVNAYAYSAILPKNWRSEMDGAALTHFRSIDGVSRISSTRQDTIIIQSPVFTEF